MKRILTEEQKQRNRERVKLWQRQFPDKVKKKNERWKQNNLEKYREQGKEKSKRWRSRNTTKCKQYAKQYKLINKTKIQIYNKQWNEKNREYRSSYVKNRCVTDAQYKLKHRLRIRLHSALKHDHKSGSAVEALGCSIQFFKTFIESKFQPGMTWQNWSHNGWHLDHIIPLSSFNLLDSEQFKVAFNYKNYQPLWASDNLSKTDNTSLFNQFFYEPISEGKS